VWVLAGGDVAGAGAEIAGGAHVADSDVQGPARLKCPGSGSALVGPGFDLQQAGPLAPAQGWLGLGSAYGRGFVKAGACYIGRGF